jgi:stearoyl-CoA desaturase (delta-9 desaturase)
MRTVFAVWANLANEGSVTTWAAWHRRHHANSDRENDSHTPYRYGSGWWNRLKGFWWAHVGWLLDTRQDPAHGRWVPDLLADPVVRRVDRLLPVWITTTFAIPTLIGYGVGGAAGAWQGFLWGGCVRNFVLWNVTWSINSVCHVFGRQPYRSRDRSGNVWWLALPTFGESWHNNHHAFPRSARNGLAWWQIDPSWYVICAFRALRLVQNPRVPNAGAQEARRVNPAPSASDDKADAL